MAQNHYDVVVIGVGSMGSAACYFLAQRGYKVLGLEQFDAPHDKGSHSGQSRIIRKAYFEHEDYVPLLERAYENWHALEEETKTKIYHRTGIVYFGPGEHATMKGVRKSSSLYNVAVEELTRDQTRRTFPAFHIPGDFETLFEPDSGFVTPEFAIRLYKEQGIAHGAEIRNYEKVTSWDKQGNVVKVTTDKGNYTADKLIITAGSWTSKLLPDLQAELKVTRQTVAWVSPKHPEKFSLGDFPCWFIEDPQRGMFYGFPVLPFENFGGPIGLKLASHSPGELIDPDNPIRRTSAKEEDDIHEILSKYIPDADGEIISLKTCLYTYSRDENFIIDHLPGYDKQVVIACGFSGHGFKFVSVIGEILADLAMNGKTAFPIGFLSVKRLG